jgi:glutathione peroxidase
MKTRIVIFSIALISIFGMFNFKLIKNIFSRKNKHYEMSTSEVTKGSLFTFTLNGIDGKPISLEKYKGKKVVIINTASKCGFTPQYADWQKFHEKYGEKVVVLGFPANDFMKQEPGSNKDIAGFCQKNYGVTFQMFEKVDVTGDKQHELFQWLSKKDQNGWNDQAPTWNFCKYIINENGQLTHFFESSIKPSNAAFIKAVGI